MNQNLIEKILDYIEALDSFEDMWNNDYRATVPQLNEEWAKVETMKQVAQQFVVDSVGIHTRSWTI